MKGDTGKLMESIPRIYVFASSLMNKTCSKSQDFEWFERRMDSCYRRYGKEETFKMIFENIMKRKERIAKEMIKNVVLENNK